MDNYDLFDLPSLVGLTFGSIEGMNGNRQYLRLAHFRWQDADHWVLCRTVWRNAMMAGSVFVQPVNSVKTYRVSLAIQPAYNPPVFRVSRPVMRRYPKSPDFRFMGFAQDRLVDIDFIRAEEQRLGANPSFSDSDKKIERPRPGLIV